MEGLQEWFPGLTIRPFPPKLEEFDRFFIFYERSTWMEAVLQECIKKYRDKTTVLNPIATPNTDYPYWEEGRFDGNQTFADNLVVFCQTILGIKGAQKQNGVVIPSDVNPRKYMHRIAIHPTSSRPGKNWPRVKFLRLAKKLKARGFEPVFIVSPKERVDWPEAPLFSTLDAMARFVAECGYMIGNDSGIGHLASLFGLPTVSLFKNERTAHFWRPSFGPNKVCLPKGWLPNIKFFRWRDQYWYWNLSVEQVLTAFEESYASTMTESATAL
jgi:hypothetical protein